MRVCIVTFVCMASFACWYVLGAMVFETVATAQADMMERLGAVCPKCEALEQ